MKLSEIYEMANTLAPKSISDEMCAKYGWYDNSGILVDVDEEITGIVFSLDLSKGAIEKALSLGANLILTHHPAIYGKISAIDCTDGGLGEKLIACIRGGISVLSMHLNLDAAKGGIDEELMKGVALSANCAPKLCATQLVMQGGGYGRAYEIERTGLSALADAMKSTFSTKRVERYGEDKEVARIASFCGSGADERSVAFSVAQGAEAMISSDFKHHVLALALESGLSVITLTHYAAENYGFKKYYEKISRQVKIPCAYHEDIQLL